MSDKSFSSWNLTSLIRKIRVCPVYLHGYSYPLEICEHLGVSLNIKEAHNNSCFHWSTKEKMQKWLMSGSGALGSLGCPQMLAVTPAGRGCLQPWGICGIFSAEQRQSFPNCLISLLSFFRANFQVYTRVRLSFSWITTWTVKYFVGSGHDMPQPEMRSDCCSRPKCLESLGSEGQVTGNSGIHAGRSPGEQEVLGDLSSGPDD